MTPHEVAPGALHYPNYLDESACSELVKETMTRADAAGWLSPVTPGGQPFSVRQINFGPLGWISDRRGYRYEPHHPETGAPWPPLPDKLAAIWRQLLPNAPDPQCCLVNHYTDRARMGLHKDADEEDQETPILTISLGQPARFRLGGPTRRGPTQSFVLRHGDVLVMGGSSRNAYHGVDRLLPGDDLFAPTPSIDGRLSLTLRRVTVSQS